MTVYRRTIAVVALLVVPSQAWAYAGGGSIIVMLALSLILVPWISGWVFVGSKGSMGRKIGLALVAAPATLAVYGVACALVTSLIPNGANMWWQYVVIAIAGFLSPLWMFRESTQPEVRDEGRG